MDKKTDDTFYKIRLDYTNDEYKTKKHIEYYLNVKNNKYTYHKIIDNQLILIKCKTNMIKNIYHIIQNIKKLKSGRIKRYRINCELELEIICEFLKNHNILHTILIIYPRIKCINYNVLYDEYKEKYNLYKTYFNRNGFEYEKNKISAGYEMYINVYKNFVNLYEITNPINIPKYGVYLYPTYPYINININKN